MHFYLIIARTKRHRWLVHCMLRAGQEGQGRVQEVAAAREQQAKHPRRVRSMAVASSRRWSSQPRGMSPARAAGGRLASSGDWLCVPLVASSRQWSSKKKGMSQAQAGGRLESSGDGQPQPAALSGTEGSVPMRQDTFLSLCIG